MESDQPVEVPTSLPPKARSFRVVAIIAGLCAVPFSVAHVFVAISTVPSIGQLFADMGGELPLATVALVAFSKSGLLAPAFIAVDIAIFVAMYRLARRYWIGLLFAPIAVYMAMNMALIPLLYLPMTSVITLVQ